MNTVAYNAWCDAIREMAEFVDEFVKPLGSVEEEPCRSQARRCLKQWEELQQTSRIIWEEWVYNPDLARAEELEGILERVLNVMGRFELTSDIDRHIRNNVTTDARSKLK